MTSTRKALEMSAKHGGNEQYQYWGSLTNSAYNVITRNEDVPIGGTKSLRWYQASSPERDSTPGPGSYSNGVNDTTFKLAHRRSPSGGTLSRSARDWHNFRPSPGPGQYESTDEGTFAKTFSAEGEPLNDTTQLDFKLRSLKHRQRQIRHLKKKNEAELNSGQRQLLRKEGSRKRMEKLASRIRALERQTMSSRRSRRDRDRKLHKDRKPPFLSKQPDRFYHPQLVPPKTPGPGTHSAHPTVASFWAATQDRAPGFGISNRPPLANGKIHSGFAAFSSYTPDVGPGQYTPDLVNTVPDGRPRTSGEVMSKVLDPSEFEYSVPEQVFAEVNIASIAHTRSSGMSPAPFDSTMRSRSRPRTVPTSPMKQASFAPHASAKFDGVLLNTVTGLPVTAKQLKGPKQLPMRLYMQRMRAKKTRKDARVEAAAESLAIADLDKWERSKLGTVLGDAPPKRRKSRSQSSIASRSTSKSWATRSTSATRR